jgi:hypothetical protein
MTELSATEARTNERRDSWLDEQSPSLEVMTAVPGLRFRAATELVRRLKLPVVCSQPGRALLGRLFNSGSPKMIIVSYSAEDESIGIALTAWLRAGKCSKAQSSAGICRQLP